ncbi:fungal-specific transcription factor domain-containing protein [Aspergillus bertholletiae]|uniref:Fungal-specific transcription factor domain-containing protein n=1 Tax=Aspergillus bertholletiae TaxID=1226010 RepID=A0A5N7BLR8_9EURO|nr:fungal-specific transcription factor domain-containing protein [Aspergillus bertholletiae]
MIHGHFSSMYHNDARGMPANVPWPLSAGQEQAQSHPNSLLHATSTAVVPPPQMLHARSCLTCRRRKVRCTRQQPCMYCNKAGTQCVFPEPPKKPGRSKKTTRMEVENRLERLESMVKYIVDRGADISELEIAPQTTDVMAVATDATMQAGDPIMPTIDEYSSQHVGGPLDECSTNDTISYQNHLDQSPLGLCGDNPLPLHGPPSIEDGGGFAKRSSAVHIPETVFPLAQWAPALWDIYTRNVAPLFPLFHKPTTRGLFLHSAQYPQPLLYNDKSLMLAISLVAVISMSSAHCEVMLGESRGRVVAYLKNAVKQSLAEAKFLSTKSLTCLQALVLFLIGMYAEKQQRFVWSMTALAVRLAQGMDLHRDGASLGLDPFQAEMRRRLWWTIHMLDVSSYEDHGTEPIINEDMFDARLPLNVNDDDIYPGMRELPAERTGGTEMTFGLMRFKAITILRQASCASGSPPQENKEASAKYYLSKVEEVRQHLKETYLQHCNLDIPIFWAGDIVSRLILAKACLVAYYPTLYCDERSSRPECLRERVVQFALEILELAYQIGDHPVIPQWGWHLKSYVQWDAMAVALSEQCLRPMGSVATGRAWQLIKWIITKEDERPTDEKGAIWCRPLSNLLARALQLEGSLQRTASLPSFLNATSTSSADAERSSGAVYVFEESSSSSLAGPLVHRERRDPLEVHWESTTSGNPYASHGAGLSTLDDPLGCYLLLLDADFTADYSAI